MIKVNIEERMNHYRVQGLSLLVIEKGQISQIEHYGYLMAGTRQKVNDQSIFNACSISKFLTSMVVMVLVEQGYFLDLDEDVNNKLKSWKVPENQYTKLKKVTLRNLLCHQSGIIDPVNSFSTLNAAHAKPSMVNLLNGTTPYCQSPIEVSGEPWHAFHYSDAGFCIIQLLIEDVMAQSFDSIIEEHIFKPLAMTHSTFSTTFASSKAQSFASGHHKNGKSVTDNYLIYSLPCGLWFMDIPRCILAKLSAKS
ncbi:Penicillin-binding protein OS=Lysinibacillus sphaericus OX=1421 GN=LS41612_12750 PE=4 SV=1 [Lysinibacillus sphaericus]